MRPAYIGGLTALALLVTQSVLWLPIHPLLAEQKVSSQQAEVSPARRASTTQADGEGAMTEVAGGGAARVEFDRAAFLALLERTPSPTLEELRPFYRRPDVIPLRPQRFRRIAEVVALGKELFFDSRLSRSGALSCASCHDPARHYLDGRPASTENAFRRSMSLYNLAWDAQFTWSGRAGSLASQAVLALTAQHGMDAPRDLPQRLAAIERYRQLFRAAFSDDVASEHLFSMDLVAYALELFIASLVAPEAPFDRWVEGEEEAISEEARQGFLLFNTKARCAFCHSSWRFSDGGLHDIGLTDEVGAGVFAPDLQYAFKAVGLRSIDERPPYMHNGMFGSLPQVIAFYNRGGDRTRPTKSPHVRPLNLTPEEQRALLAFLSTLRGDRTASFPRLPDVLR